MRRFLFGKSPIRTITTRQALVIALVSLAVLIPYTSPGGVFAQHAKPLALRVDEGTVMYDSLRVAQGQVPYRDFFEFPGPMTFFYYGAIFRFIEPTLAAARWGNILLIALGAGLGAIVASRLAGRLAGIAVALLQVFAFFPCYPFAYTHWIAQVFGLAAVALIGLERPKKSTDIVGGIFCGLSMMTILSVGLPLWAAAIGTVWTRGAARRDLREALRRPAFVLFGGALVIGVLSTYFAILGALPQFIYCTWTWPLSQYAIGQGEGMNYGHALDAGLAAHSQLSEPLRTAASMTLKFVVGAPLGAAFAAVVIAIGSLVAIVRRRYEHTWRVVTGGMCFAAVFPPLVGKTRADVTHLGFVALFGLLTICAFLHFFRRRLYFLRIGAGALCICGLIGLYTYGAKYQILRPTVHYTSFKEEFEADYLSSGMMKVVHRNLSRHMDPKDPIVIGLMSGYYYFFYRPCALPVTRLSSDPLNEYYTNSQLRTFGNDIMIHQPKVIGMWTPYQFYVLTKRVPQLLKMYRRYAANVWVLDSWATEKGLLPPLPADPPKP
jgi:hypothetical protein